MDRFLDTLSTAPDFWFPVMVILGVQLVEAAIDTWWPRKPPPDEPKP